MLPMYARNLLLDERGNDVAESREAEVDGGSFPESISFGLRGLLPLTSGQVDEVDGREPRHRIPKGVHVHLMELRRRRRITSEDAEGGEG